MSAEFLKNYRAHVAERAALGIPPLPLSAKQTGEVIELLKNPPKGEEAALVELLSAQEARIVSTVSDRLQAFGKQTQRAIDKLAQSNQPRQDAAVSQLPSQMGRVHVVSPGETLSAIARMYHVSVSILQRVNDVKDPTRLQVGQDLFIPEPE